MLGSMFEAYRAFIVYLGSLEDVQLRRHLQDWHFSETQARCSMKLPRNSLFSHVQRRSGMTDASTRLIHYTHVEPHLAQ